MEETAMSDIEGALCDECGTRIGPFGCCATIRWTRSTVKVREAEIGRLEGLIRDLRTGQMATNARLDALELALARARAVLEAYHREHCARVSGDTVVECTCSWCHNGMDAVVRIDTLMPCDDDTTHEDP